MYLFNFACNVSTSLGFTESLVSKEWHSNSGRSSGTKFMGSVVVNMQFSQVKGNEVCHLFAFGETLTFSEYYYNGLRQFLISY